MKFLAVIIGVLSLSFTMACGETSTEECHAMDEAACKADSACVPVVGEHLETANACFSELTFVACDKTPFGFNNAITYGKDPSTGECWFFRSNGFPTTWTACDNSEQYVDYKACK